MTLFFLPYSLLIAFIFTPSTLLKQGLICKTKEIGRGYTQISPDKRRRGHDAEVNNKKRNKKNDSPQRTQRIETRTGETEKRRKKIEGRRKKIDDLGITIYE